jgi:O-glycosyl hydrolase
LRGEISVESSFLSSDWIVVVTAVVAVRKATRAEKGERIEVVVEEGTPPLTSAVVGYGSSAFEIGAHLPAASAGTFAVRSEHVSQNLKLLLEM